MRGSHLVTAFSNICGGLSPRVRGSHTVAFGEIFSDGSIPTCAGQPTRYTTLLTAKKVYPHVCGAAFLRRDLCI